MMRLTIERLRAGVVAGTLLLLTTLGGVLLYAHHRAHGVLRNLPSRLGLDIQKQTNGVTFSQTIKGQTIFTVHAAKATQYRNGKAELEDAGVVLYGAGGRADRIYGRRFHYDQAAGVIHALGQVQLDLQAAAPVTPEDRLRFASGAIVTGKAAAAGGDVQQPVHVTTSDLVYSQRSRMASTPEPLHFEYSGVVGDARGASYNAQTGFTTFEHDITLSGSEDGRAFHLAAAHGELDRAANRLTLRTALLERPVTGRAAETISAAVLVLHLAPGGGVDRVEGTDGVAISASDGSARAPLAELTLRSGNHPEQVRMRGGVQFSHTAEGEAAETISGSAEECVGRFDQGDALSTLLLSRNVVVEASSARAGGRRRLTGGQVLLALASSPGVKQRWVRQATAEGAAELRIVRTDAPESTDVLGADKLEGQLHLDSAGHTQLEAVSGRGHVLLHRSAGAVEEVSRAETINASFASAGAGGSAGSRPGMQVLSAVERGSVTLDRSNKAANGRVESVHGSAREATYDGAARRTTLLGDAVLTQAADTVRADRVVMANETGDAEAYGDVQAMLTSADRPAGVAGGVKVAAGGAPSPEPVHAVAASASFEHAPDVVTLFGDATRVARIWRGASQVEAPVLTLRHREGTLDASGAKGNDAATVKTVLAGDSAGGSVGAAASKRGTVNATKIVRVESARLHYSDPERQAEFAGGVVLRSADGVVQARRAVATMVAAESAGKVPLGKGRESADGSGQGSASLLAGGLERVVADGGIRVEQPGRVATGQQVVYTASDGLFVLTGTPSDPPVVEDQTTGSLTGAVLRFHAGDNGVAVEGSQLSGKGGRVHTELRLKQ